MVVGAMIGALDVAQNRVDPGERRMPSALRSTSGHERLVNTPDLFHRGEAAQGVGHHDGAGLQMTPGPGRDLVVSKPTDTAQAQPHRPALIIELHGGHERRLAWRASPGFPPAALPAPIRIIELHPAAQRARVVALLHHLHQLVLDLPGGVVAHRKLPRQLQRRYPVLRLRHQVHRQEPRAKWQLRARENRARGQRNLVPAATALIQRPALMAPVPGMLASGANEPVRPTPTKQRLGALLLTPVLVHELHQTVALLKLNPIPCHVRLPIFQPLGTIRTAVAHWMSLVRNQEQGYVRSPCRRSHLLSSGSATFLLARSRAGIARERFRYRPYSSARCMAVLLRAGCGVNPTCCLPRST